MAKHWTLCSTLLPHLEYSIQGMEHLSPTMLVFFGMRSVFVVPYTEESISNIMEFLYSGEIT